jgi:hypothetical protein
MTDVTLEALAERVAALERKLAGEPDQDWRRVVGILGDSEFARRMVEETLALREAEREAARGSEEEP